MQKNRCDGVDANREQPNRDDMFRATPDIRGGVACFAGTRVGVSQLLGYLRDGHTIDDFVRDFLTVTKEQAQRAIERIDNEYVRGIERDCTGEHQQARDTGYGTEGAGTKRRFADPLNLTLAAPAVNRHQKSGKIDGERIPRDEPLPVRGPSRRDQAELLVERGGARPGRRPVWLPLDQDGHGRRTGAGG